MNRHPGGEGGLHGVSPFYLYVIGGSEDGWRKEDGVDSRCNMTGPRPWELLAPPEPEPELELGPPPSDHSVSARLDNRSRSHDDDEFCRLWRVRSAFHRERIFQRSRSPRTAAEPC